MPPLSLQQSRSVSLISIAEGDGGTEVPPSLELLPSPSPRHVLGGPDLKQEFDSLNGSHRRFADGRRDAAREEVLGEGDGLLCHGCRSRSEPPGGTEGRGWGTGRSVVAAAAQDTERKGLPLLGS